MHKGVKINSSKCTFFILENFDHCTTYCQSCNFQHLEGLVHKVFIYSMKFNGRVFNINRQFIEDMQHYLRVHQNCFMIDTLMLKLISNAISYFSII